MASSDVIACMPSELDIFSRSRIQNAILGHQIVGVKTTNAITQPLCTLEFAHSGSSDMYRDLRHVYLKLKICLKAADGQPLLLDNGVGVVNNLLYSLFHTMEVFLNEKCVARVDHFGYKNYIEPLLNYTPAAAETHLTTSMFYLDTPDHVNDATDENAGFTKRKELLLNSKTVELYGRLKCGVFDQNLLIPQGMDLRIKLTFANPSFFMWSGAAAANSVLHVLDSTLYLKQVALNPGVLIAHAKILAQTNALFPMKRVEMKSFTVSPGARSLSLNNVCLGRLPSFLCFTMVDNASFNGSLLQNPYALIHKSITDLSIFYNSDEFKLGPMDFHSESPCFTSAYHSLFNAIGVDRNSLSNFITPEMFHKGSFLVCRDLSADNSGHTNYCSLASNGIVRTEANFAHPIDSAVTCLVYLEYDCVMELDSSRNVFIS